MNVFHWLEVKADEIEAHLPGFLRYDVVGDPASWVQHGMICSAVSGVGAAISFAILHDVHPGLRFFSAGAAVYYLIRESIQAAGHAVLEGWAAAVWIRRRADGGLLVGWGLDGLGDFALPLLIPLLAWFT